MNFSPRLALSIVSLAILTALPAAAQTLTFDDLTSPQGLTTDTLPFPVANSGSRLYDGVTFNATASSDWEVIGSQFSTTFGSTDYYAVSDPGSSYYVAGNAFVGTDNGNVSYTGLTISTTKDLNSLDIGYGNNFQGSTDANSVTITAFGVGGDLASVTSALSSSTLSLLDTSSKFGLLTGVTGYRFTTVSNDPLDAAVGHAWIVADNMTFSASNPVPEASTTVSFGLLLILGLGGMAAAARKRRSA